MPHRRKISVIGLGYVGLPVAVEFGKKGPVVGFDVKEERVRQLRGGHDLTGEVSEKELRSTQIRFTTDPKDLRQADFHIVAVPTPVDDAKQPDMTPVLRASESVGSQLKKGDIVVYESTVYPGATEEDCVPVLEKCSGLKCGPDFTVGYSPERINPGDKAHSFSRIKKVVSGQDERTGKIVAEVYGSVVEAGVHIAPSIKVAESAKIIENIQRDVNIALMNELSVIFHKLGIDTPDVLEAARTKWNFLPFSPGLVGGHCIGVDPYYMSHKAARLGYIPQMVLSGRRMNDSMASFVAENLVRELIHFGVAVKGAKVAVLGLSFKEDVPDLRNSKVAEVIQELKAFGVSIEVHDPMVDLKEAEHEYGIKIVPLEAMSPAQAVLLAVPHAAFKQAGWALPSRLLFGGKGVVIDVRSILPRAETPAGIRLWRL